MLTCTLALQARTKCVSAFWAQPGPRHFSCQFESEVALVKCWNALRLRRLAQSVVLGSGPRHFFCKFPFQVALVKSWSTFRLRILKQCVCLRSGLNLGRGIFLAKTPLLDLTKRSCQEVSYRDLGPEVLQDTSSRDLCWDLAMKSLAEILPKEVL